jgi:hypothetical protein
MTRPGNLERPPWPQRKLPKHAERRGLRLDHEASGSAGGDCEPSVYFKHGHPGYKPRGPNKFGRNLREAILEAAAACEHSKTGDLHGFLVHCATEHTAAYLRVIGKLLPYRFDVNANARTETAVEIRARLEAMGIPLPETLFTVPKVPTPSPKPAPEPPEPERDEDRLDYEPRLEPEPEPSVENGLDRQHEPSRSYALDPARDVRNHKVTISSPSLNGWHSLAPGAQLDLPITDEESQR